MWKKKLANNATGSWLFLSLLQLLKYGYEARLFSSRISQLDLETSSPGARYPALKTNELKPSKENPT